MYWHIETDIVSLCVLIILTFYTRIMLQDDTCMSRNKGFMRCLETGVLMIVVDIAASLCMDFSVPREIYQFFMTVYLLTQELVVLSWLLYALTILFEKSQRIRQRISYGMLSVFLIYSASAVTNPWTGLFFHLIRK